MLMSEVCASLIQDLRDDLGKVLPDPGRLTRLFNEVQLDMSVEMECVAFRWQTVVQPYEVISGTMNDASSAARIVVLDDTDDDTDIDKTANYAGWTLKDTVTLDQAKVVRSYTVAGNLVGLVLDHLISINATEDDTFTLTHEQRYVDCPWFVIRPYLDEGVLWDGLPLTPVSFSRQNSYQDEVTTGTPYNYAIENVGAGVCRIHLYPRPSEAGILSVSGSRRSAECFYGETNTTIGADDGSDLTS